MAVAGASQFNFLLEPHCTLIDSIKQLWQAREPSFVNLALGRNAGRWCFKGTISERDLDLLNGCVLCPKEQYHVEGGRETCQCCCGGGVGGMAVVVVGWWRL